MSEYPSDWIQTAFSSICEKILDGTHYSPKTKSGPRLYLTSKNIKEGRIDLSDISYISEEEHREIYSRCDVKKGDILFTKDGANTGNTAINPLSEEFSLLSSVALIRPDGEFCDTGYAFQWMRSHDFQALLKARMAGNAISRLTLEKINDLPIALPPLPEQKKIAEILSGIDNIIRAIDAKIKKLGDAKAEVSRDVFSDFSLIRTDGVLHKEQGYTVLPLEDACEAVIDCKNRTPPYTEKGYPVIRTPNVRSGRLVFNDLRYTDEDSYHIWTARSVPREMDILFTREAPLGEACLIPHGFQCCLGQRMMLFRANKSLLEPQYLLFALMSPFVQEQLGRSKGGTTVGHARVADIRNIKIPILPMKKQTQIAFSLASINSCLQHTIEKKKKMQVKKNALASELLSGRKRVSI